MELSGPVKRHWAFAVPFFNMTVADAGPLNERLIAELNASRAAHQPSHFHKDRYENTYVGVDHVPSANAVFDIAEQVASQMLGRPLIIPRKAQPGESLWYWFNETTKRGGLTGLHNHWSPWTYFSGCYYIKVPPKSGNFVFSRSRSNILIDGQALPEAPFFRDIEIPPAEGMLILFPSWLEHLVRPNETDETRISLAFNFCPPDGSKANFVTSAVGSG